MNEITAYPAKKHPNVGLQSSVLNLQLTHWTVVEKTSVF